MDGYVSVTSGRAFGCKDETCNWQGNAQQALTIPRVDPWLQSICENFISRPGTDTSETHVI